MKKQLRRAAGGAVFLCALWLCVCLVWRVMTPKFFLSETWPTTSTYLGFYQMEENTVDVLFFGSSHAASFFLPQELYNEYGITGYNLGCEQQNLVVSYFWLKEALRFQKPKAVVLDCYMLFPYLPQEPLNTAESCTRKAMDYMRWSKVKREAVHAICEADENQSEVSYYFPNIRYHRRWEGLSEHDFSSLKTGAGYELKGYAPLAHYCGRQDFVPFERGAAEQEAEMVPVMREYLDRITELCRQEGITLILVKTPTTSQNPQRNLAVSNYAGERGLLFLDFNERERYEEIGFCFQTDNCDDGHGNIWGAQKVTKKIGSVLTEFGIGGREDSQWEETRACYEMTKKDCELTHVTDFIAYTEAIQDGRYTVFFSAKEVFTAGLTPAVLSNLKSIGLQTDLWGLSGSSYLAVVSGETVTEQFGSTELCAEGTVRDGTVRYELLCAGSAAGNVSSVKIDGRECGKNGRGLNIVVYNNETGKLVDSVCFDTCDAGSQAVR